MVMLSLENRLLSKVAMKWIDTQQQHQQEQYHLPLLLLQSTGITATTIDKWKKFPILQCLIQIHW